MGRTGARDGESPRLQEDTGVSERGRKENRRKERERDRGQISQGGAGGGSGQLAAKSDTRRRTLCSLIRLH